MSNKHIGEIKGVVRKRIGNREYFFGTLNSDKAKDLLFVPVIESSKKTYLTEDTTEGYQRPATVSRMNAFKRFLADNPNSVVPPIVISGRQNWEFVPAGKNSDYGDLKIQGAAAIIDGQHRAGGYVALYEEDDADGIRPIDFILLVNLDRDDEIEEFTVVNNTQKGVPKSLTMFLEEDEEAMIAWEINVNQGSPFHDRIARTSTQRHHLFQLHSVSRQLKKMFSNDAFEGLNREDKVDAVLKFWSIISEEMPEQWADLERLYDDQSRGRSDFEFKLLELTGFIAWSIVGKNILVRSFNAGIRDFHWGNVRNLVKFAKQIDWTKSGHYQGQTGEYGGAQMAQEMLRLLPAEGTEAALG